MTGRPDRVIGLHYFFHPAKNRLVEIVPAADTSKDTLTRARAFQDALGNVSIRCSDRAGFIVNRFFVPWLNEAVRLLAEGVADIPTIDAAARERFGIGIGPFHLMNITGVPIALHAAATLGRELGPFYAPDARLAQQVDARTLWPLAGVPDPARSEEAADRLEGAVFFAAASLVEEGVGTLDDTDIGARVGLRWSKGPFERMNHIGTAAAGRLAAAVVDRFGLALPPGLAGRGASGALYGFQRIRLEVEDGIATLTVNRPDALNALNPEVVSELDRKVDEALARADVTALLLRGSGKAFVAGADIKFFDDRMASNDLGGIETFTRVGQQVLRKLETAAKPTIALLDGLALGGGAELALACQQIVATSRGSIGFPETGLGIYPGLGGTQRTTRRIGVALAKWLVLTGTVCDARTAMDLGLVDRLVTDRAELPAVLRELAGARTGRTAVVVPECYRNLVEMFANAAIDDLLTGQVATKGDPMLERAVQQVRSKAPLASRLAARLIDEGEKLPLTEALELENMHTREVFSSKDAREGMTALLERRRPSFIGG